MPEYIEREALMAEINRIGGHNLCEWNTLGVKALAERQPTADVAKVKRGEWKVETYKTSDAKFIKCSNCNSVIDSNFTHIDENEFDFCPYCGADMRGEQCQSDT